MVLATLMGFLLLTPLPARASREVLQEIAVENPVDGWNVLPDSSTYGSSDGLADIYDGGYELYTDAGVLDALRRIYVKDEEYVEITVHGMRSSQAARDFLADRFAMETGKEAPTGSGWDRFTASGAGSTTAYCIRGLYFITVVAYHDGEKGKAQTEPFIKSQGEKAANIPRKAK
jgi:hypothetical protein